MAFANTHLSFSRLQRFQQCPLSFKLPYVDPSVPYREFGHLLNCRSECFQQVTSVHVGEARALLDFARFCSVWTAGEKSPAPMSNLASTGAFVPGGAPRWHLRTRT